MSTGRPGMIAELKKNTTFRHMVAASSRLRHGALGLEVAPLEVLWAPRPRYHAIYRSPCWLAVKTARSQTAHGGGGGGNGRAGRSVGAVISALLLPPLSPPPPCCYRHLVAIAAALLLPLPLPSALLARLLLSPSRRCCGRRRAVAFAAVLSLLPLLLPPPPFTAAAAAAHRPLPLLFLAAQFRGPSTPECHTHTCTHAYTQSAPAASRHAGCLLVSGRQLLASC